MDKSHVVKSRMQEIYTNTIRPQMQKDLGILNIMQVPRISKIVLNVGVKEAVSDSRVLKQVVDILTRISGQKPVLTAARKSIAGFKLRQGMPIGVKVTLRQSQMYHFLDKLINVALPKVKDLQGVPFSFDRQGNYNLGVKEWTIFPEADTDSVSHALGMNIAIVTTARSDDMALDLLKKFGMPFVKLKNN